MDDVQRLLHFTKEYVISPELQVQGDVKQLVRNETYMVTRK